MKTVRQLFFVYALMIGCMTPETQQPYLKSTEPFSLGITFAGSPDAAYDAPVVVDACISMAVAAIVPGSKTGLRFEDQEIFTNPQQLKIFLTISGPSASRPPQLFHDPACKEKLTYLDTGGYGTGFYLRVLEPGEFSVAAMAAEAQSGDIIRLEIKD